MNDKKQDVSKVEKLSKDELKKVSGGRGHTPVVSVQKAPDRNKPGGRGPAISPTRHT